MFRVNQNQKLHGHSADADIVTVCCRCDGEECSQVADARESQPELLHSGHILHGVHGHSADGDISD